MKVSQIYEILNQQTQEFLGTESGLTVATDLTNIVDIGNALFDATSVDNYVQSLIDHIGRVVFVDRKYEGRAPSVLMESWEYGAVLEKIDADIPEASANPTWQLTNGTRYDQDIFTQPKGVRAKFFKDRVTFDVEISFADRQVKSAFSNASQLNAFFSMIYNKINTSMTIKSDALIMDTIDNFIAATYDAGGTRAINLLAEYKAEVNPASTLTAANCIYDLDFIKFASYKMKVYSDRLKVASTLFNIGGKVRFTPQEYQHIVMLDIFARAADVYLQSDTFHNELTKLPEAQLVSFWGGTGTDFSFDEVSSINVVVKNASGVQKTVQVSGILGVIFDRDALGVNHLNKRVTSHYNAKAEFTNNWYKMDAQYFNDYDENFILFYVADAASSTNAQSLKTK